MAKRFTDTGKWDDPWFRKLPSKFKVVWEFLRDKVDNAGFWKKDFELMAFFTQETSTPDDILRAINDGKTRIKDHGDHWELVDFVAFQFGDLSRDCKAHTHIFALKEKYASKGYPMGIHTHKDKETDKDKDKDKDKDIKGGAGGKPTLDMVKDYFAALGHPGEAEPFFDHYEANGWKIGGIADVHSWPALCRKWLRNPKREKNKTSTQRFKDGVERDAKDLKEWEEMKHGKKDSGHSNKLLAAGVPTLGA